MGCGGDEDTDRMWDSLTCYGMSNVNVDKSASSPPPPPGPALNAFPPDSNMLFKVKDPNQSLLNSFCAQWRDESSQKGFAWQVETMAKCMVQDCQQSLEDGKNGCRFVDKSGLCFAYASAQLWCSSTPNNQYCNDQGAAWATKPFGTAKDALSTKWMPPTKILVANPIATDPKEFKCACYKDCTCSFKTGSQKGTCQCSAGQPTSTVGDKTVLGSNKFIKASNDGKCACRCGSN